MGHAHASSLLMYINLYVLNLLLSSLRVFFLLLSFIFPSSIFSLSTLFCIDCHIFEYKELQLKDLKTKLNIVVLAQKKISLKLLILVSL